MKIDTSICKKYGIENAELIDLQQTNIIIGENGAGKTRLLKAIKEYFTSNSITTIYAYLPDIKPHYQNTTTEFNTEKSFYEMFFYNDSIDLYDFMNYVEMQGIDFLTEVLVDIERTRKFKKSSRHERAENVLNSINNILDILIKRNLIWDETVQLHSKVYNKTENLEDALANMSPGELSLFYLAFLITFITSNNDKKIAILIDEPELHLHPNALVNFFEYINNNENVQFCCIATHSIYLIPLVDFYSIVYVSDSKIQNYNSKLYNKIFNSVVGSVDGLSDFLISRESWQYYKFIAECFTLPKPISKINTKDEQFIKFSSYISEKLVNNKKVTLLDYGAGSGRLYKMIEASKKENLSDYSENLKYFYYDKYEKKPEDLECPSFEKIEDIIENKKKFDCVVLMNVLHEIDICDWEKTFQEIQAVLKRDGFLLIFEVRSLLHGEHPYGNSGYILLDEKHINALFATNGLKNIKITNNDKSNMFIIDKSSVCNASYKSILHSLKLLRRDSYSKLKKQYKYKRMIAHSCENPTPSKTKQYAFISQQYINSIFAIDMLQANHHQNNQQEDPVIELSEHELIISSMEFIGLHGKGAEVERVFNKLLNYFSTSFQNSMRTYLTCKNSYQRKYARKYFYLLKNKYDRSDTD